MQRRSRHLPNSVPKSLAEEGHFEPEDEDVAYEEDDVKHLSKKPRKKRKAVDEMADRQPQVKKVRGKRGILKQLVEMPLDVLFEIFGRLEPLDLLHLARTTKDLRNLLMNRSSTSIWKQSRSNLPQMPDCPPDLSEPQYANFIFGKSCHFCNRNLSNMHIVCSARFRTCTKCLAERFVDAPFGRYPTQLATFAPNITINKKSGRYMRSKTVYYGEVVERWGEEYTNAKDKARWLREKVEERRIIEKHADACILWFDEMQAMREEEKASIIDGRKAVVVEHLKKLGWEDELSKMSENDDKPQDDPLVLKACQKDITELTLSNLEEFLNLFMQNQRRKRLLREREELLDERLPILKRVLLRHISTLPPNALHPSAGELFRDPIVLDIINNTPRTVDFTEGHFDPIIPMLPDITVRWQKEMEEKLLDLIRQADPEYIFNRETVINLATTSFDCKHCDASYLRFPDVLMHPCATRIYYFHVEDGSDLGYLKDILLETFWNSAESIYFNVKSVESLSKVVEMSGFDPKTTTVAEMDIANPIVECVACNNVQEGRLTMAWSSVPAHRFPKHQSIGEMKLELLNEREADIARARLSEMEERRRAGKHFTEMICVHCKKTGNTPQMRKHVYIDHGKSNPTDEDITLLLKARRSPLLFHLWPPRDGFGEEPPATMAVTN